MRGIAGKRDYAGIRLGRVSYRRLISEFLSSNFVVLGRHMMLVCNGLYNLSFEDPSHIFLKHCLEVENSKR